MNIDVTTVVVNFKTPALVRDAIESFITHYPRIPIIAFDNGGCARSLAVLRELARKHVLVSLIPSTSNIGHGPALHKCISDYTTTSHVFTLDSDTRVKRGGFIEKMLHEFTSDASTFAVGWLRYVNDNGVASPHQELQRGRPYVHPHACLLDRDKYLTLSPFVHTGAPAIRLMIDAAAHDYRLVSFPISDYIWHKIAGTRGRFGGEWRVRTNAKPTVWRPCRI